ncbi:hypothetical protein [Butyrivibrio sp. AE3004]|uniref:hypothetical protein n=1 Tax=Butyrivibrio sp. AE3004 TaxID=1506994 RepID=UPI00068D9F7B|nr:hypothetical protein [Butyrivibrio sp. AE3004]
MALTNVMTQSLISASTSMKQIQLQQGVKKQMDGKAGVLDAEIKRDEASGADTTKKKEVTAKGFVQRQLRYHHREHGFTALSRWYRADYS